jgi:NAD(P)-dependent dehydrogenase (short-subunit alcohol dehydrogenase family)
MRKPGDIEALFANLGHAEVLVNNAGISGFLGSAIGLKPPDFSILGLFAVEGFGLAVNNGAAFLVDDLSGEGLRAVFASPSNSQ